MNTRPLMSYRAVIIYVCAIPFKIITPTISNAPSQDRYLYKGAWTIMDSVNGVN